MDLLSQPEVRLLSKVVGVAYPPVAAAAEILDYLNERRDQREQRNLMVLVKRLRERLDRQDAERVPVPIDLFAEIFSNARQEEDELKLPYYAALVE